MVNHMSSEYLERAFPALAIAPIEDLAMGDILWGWEEQANYPRKGWHVEPEGMKVRLLAETDDRWIINNTPFLKGSQCPRYFLIEEPE